ncbi:hypothetical protein DENIS_2573 [Desulfonema ishimotonii]|uniref:Transporter n=1 Tax=Desulfonema ishimotonii TaxID=45657 RepID=A0A401FXC3_9BACT|nr:transporter [Desulfonema ishimotonii]GBC61611.1 hypothetical protein DENIS_2573 [Desulfonema ishimotonii]
MICKRVFFKIFCFTLLAVCLTLGRSGPVSADENLALYGLKGYAYSWSPLVVDGLHLQAGAMYSPYENNSLNCREGYIWAFPISLTYGDGNWWEVAAATHFEYWRNNNASPDYDADESGFGDLFLGGKVRLLGQDRGNLLDLALMPYLLLPTGNRDKGITDLYRFIQTDEDHPGLGLNLLLGHRWDRIYLAANFGINYMDTDDEYTEDSAVFMALTLEYQLRENLTSYLEFANTENKNDFNCPECSPCFDEDNDEDIREIGVGVNWLRGLWGFKLHVGAGLTDTSPDVRVIGLINRNLAY